MIGFNGNFNAGVRNQREAKFNSSIDMNYRNGKYNVYGSYGSNIAKNQTNGLISQIENNSFQTLSLFDNNKSHLYKLGVDLYLNDKNTISVFTNQNIFNGKNLSASNFIFNENMSNNQIQINDGLRENNSSQYNFNYKLDFDKEGHNIELEIDYNIFDNTIETDNILSGLNIRPSYLELTNTDRNNTTINLDYVNPLSEKSKLELGLQARLFENEIIKIIAPVAQKSQLGKERSADTDDVVDTFKRGNMKFPMLMFERTSEIGVWPEPQEVHKKRKLADMDMNE